LLILYPHLHLSVSAESEIEREDETAQFIIILRLLCIFVFILRMGREEGKKMRNELTLIDDTPYIYIHLQIKSSWLSYNSGLNNVGA
jgi:hypothetical protein